MTRPFLLGWSLCCSPVALAGCAHETTPPPAMATGDYRLGVDDLIEVAVWKDAALSATVPVRPDGKVALPMVGELPAAGRTPHELEHELADRLRAVIADPTVTVMLKEVRAARFFVLGEVAHPGAYPLSGALTVVEALAMAGGPTEFARRGRVVVIRRTGAARPPERFRVDYDDVVSGHTSALPLLAGDTIYVP